MRSSIVNCEKRRHVFHRWFAMMSLANRIYGNMENHTTILNRLPTLSKKNKNKTLKWLLKI